MVRVPFIYPFETFAVWKYEDGTLYYLGKTEEWTVRYQGTVTPNQDGGFDFAPDPANGVFGTATFTNDNTTPVQVIQAADPPLTANTGDTDWR